MRIRLLVTGSVLALALALACSSNEEPPPTQTDAGISPAVAEHLQTLNEAITAKRSECNPYSHSLRDFLTEKFKRNLEAGAIAGRLVFQPEAVEACIRLFPPMSCAEFNLFSWSAECLEPVFEPRVAPGGECFESFECVDGWCDHGSACPGRCVASLQEGEDCTRGKCGGDTYCGSDHRCVAHKQLGEACVDFSVCDQGLFCDSFPYAQPPVQGKCVPEARTANR